MSAVAAANVVALRPAPETRPPGLLPWEDAEAFSQLRAAFLAAHSPEGPTESALIDRLIWIEWRRRRLLAAEAAVHVAHAFDRANEDQAKRRTLTRAGVTDHKTRDQISLSEVLRGSDRDDAETIEAIQSGIVDVEAALELIDAANGYEDVLARLDDDMRDWWTGELGEAESGQPKYGQDCESLRRFLVEDALPWRRGWLATNAARPAIRAQAIAESFDPARVRQLWEMEARLDRQFEKALSMLIRLQEMRSVS